jgi:hypothetical protein
LNIVKVLILTAFIFVITSITGFSQSNWRKSIPVSIDGGLQLPSITRDSLSSWNADLVKSIHLRSGVGLLYKNRFGLLAEGGLLIHNVDFRSANYTYSVATLLLTLNCTPYVLFPLKSKPQTNIHIGSGVGYGFMGGDKLTKNSPGFIAVSTSKKIRPLTFAPELGITWVDKKILVSLLATYNYQMGIEEISTTTITDNNGKYTSTIKGDYLGFKIRMEFKFGKEKVYPNIYKQTPTENDVYVKRANSVIRNYKTRKDYVLLEFYESNKVDHDSISVSVNGKYILINHGLTNEKVTIRVPLEKGVNSITVYALNEGDIPPNTATCLIHFGNRKEEFSVQTGHKKNATVEIERK